MKNRKVFKYFLINVSKDLEPVFLWQLGNVQWNPIYS